MIYRTLADLVVLAHVAFIVFVVAGGVLALRWHWMPWLHLPAAGWGALLEFRGWICPLTPLENRLRQLGGAEDYAGGFVEQYLLPMIYPAALTREAQVGLGAVVCLVNVAIYLFVWRSRYRAVRTNKPRKS